MESQYIEIDDGLDMSEIRLLMEITKDMAGAINHEEFNEILNVYNKATKRLLNTRG